MRPLVLLILDGWGYSSHQLGNAIASANTPTLDSIQANYPALLLQASGKAIGLSWQESGNSEVGHLTIGAGRTVYQYSTRISRAIENGSFFTNPAFLEPITYVNKFSGTLHLIGLLGSGTVHSNFEHLLALTELVKQQGMKKMAIHLFGDGKDSGTKEALTLLNKLQAHLNKHGLGEVVSMIGRQFAMDRKNNWNYTETAYRLWMNGAGRKVNRIEDGILDQYGQSIHDGELEPMCLDQFQGINNNDGIIFFNYREDSMRQIAQAFVDPDFHKFPLQRVAEFSNKNLNQNNKFDNLFQDSIYSVAFMTQYLPINPHTKFTVAFPPPIISSGLSQIISASGYRQLYIAETEKYAHVTYFLRCLRENPVEGETDILLDSVPNVLVSPQMRALDIADTLTVEIQKNIYDLFVVNIANPDVLAHLGDLNTTIQGIGYTDAAVNKIHQAISEKNGILVITSDHGNAESLVYKGTGDVETRHNSNPVPFYLVAREFKRERSAEEISKTLRRAQGILSDVAPTILDLLDIPKPVEMTGESLLPLLV